MIDFTLFTVFLITGWFTNLWITQSQQTLLKKLAYDVLFIFVIISLWLYGLPEQSWELILLGGLLQITPAIIGSLFGNNTHGQAFLLFSTFGGGNRGTLALSLLSPALLPIFVLIDLGNFLSLILFYPALIRWGLSDKKDNRASSPSFMPLLTSVSVLVIGFTLHSLGYGLENGVTANLHQVLKWLLIVLTSLQIGIHLTLDTRCLIWTLKSMIQVRLVALVLPLLFALWLIPDATHGATPILLLFAVLPVSSLVIGLLPPDTDQAFQQQLACAVTASTLIFLMILATVALMKFLL